MYFVGEQHCAGGSAEYHQHFSGSAYLSGRNSGMSVGKIYGDCAACGKSRELSRAFGYVTRSLTDGQHLYFAAAELFFGNVLHSRVERTEKTLARIFSVNEDGLESRNG